MCNKLYFALTPRTTPTNNSYNTALLSPQHTLCIKSQTWPEESVELLVTLLHSNDCLTTLKLMGQPSRNYSAHYLSHAVSSVLTKSAEKAAAVAAAVAGAENTKCNFQSLEIPSDGLTIPAAMDDFFDAFSCYRNSSTRAGMQSLRIRGLLDPSCVARLPMYLGHNVKTYDKYTKGLTVSSLSVSMLMLQHPLITPFDASKTKWHQY